MKENWKKIYNELKGDQKSIYIMNLEERLEGKGYSSLEIMSIVNYIKS